MTAPLWHNISGAVECHEARVTTKWPEYVRGVIIAQDQKRAEKGYTAYIEYFTYGFPRQLWGGCIFTSSAQAKAWCEGEMLRHAPARAAS